jgi:TolB protein
LGLAGFLVLLFLAVSLVEPALRAPQPVVAVPEVPAAAQESALALLAAAGYAAVAPPAWAGTEAAWPAPGSYQLFFAAPAPEGSADVYAAEAHVNNNGQISRIAAVTRLTDTPAGAETAPLLAGNWLAFATRAAGRYQSVTCISLGNLSHQAVFAFDRPAEQVTLRWQATDAAQEPKLVVVAGEPAGQITWTIDPAALHVEPADSGLAYLPVVRGEQAWLPNLVSRVRELPGVGPEKIAFLENVYFTVVDQVTRWLRGPAQPELVQGTAVPPVATDAVASPTAEPAAVFTMPAVAELTLPTTLALAPDIAEDLSAATSTPILLPTDTPTSVATDTPAPSPTPAGARLAEGIFRRLSVKPDPQRPYAEVELIEIDPALLQIKMIPGTIEPKPTTGLIGSGVIPQEDWPNLAAAFNGGFAAMHGKFGMVVDRKVYLPPRDGVATLAVYDDGSIRMGTWGKDLTQTPDMVSYRQNCPPLIENGTITAETGKLTLWGLSVSNEVYLYRSGLGLTADGRLIYAVGKPLSAYTLAQALQMAGAVYAMQLDVDEYHVAFITYEVQTGQPGQPPKVVGKKLRADMRGFDGLFLRPFQLDFFYLVRRPQRLARPVRPIQGKPMQPAQPATTTPGTPFPVSLPGQLAFASNRDGNWEIYALSPGRPDAVQRLTDHPADDLYPAWSPDGRQLAFTSRRDGNAEIYALNLAGGTLSRVTRQPSEEWAPAWSPDGARLVYQSDRNGQSDIYVSATDGSGETRLTPYEGNHEAPHWSPDGRRIVFDSDLDVGEAVHASINLYFMNADGTNPRRFYSHAESPAWSPDGKTIAFTALRGGLWQIFLLNTDGTGYRQLTNGRYNARYPAWSPDGRWLAFAGNEEGHWELYVTSMAGDKPIRLTNGTADNSYPAWGK